ncbi:hypothetical protein C5167_004648 [Papaver somniferum]|uniref:Uncharacterized protein n=1 Tax=Papaver somniferum TaxID=3469 RepID=A0A4Y7J948_PAPSO|nr:hypothetical protein C5167_004648 [Papaver somniferum]
MAHPWSKARRATRFRFHPVQYQRVSTQEAQLAKQKMNGRLACGRPLVVRYASEKYYLEMLTTAPKPFKVGIVSEEKKASQPGSSTHTGQMSRSAKIAAIKNKLKSLEENCCLKKKPRQGDSVT